MSQETKRLRGEFYRSALYNGWTSVEQVTGAWHDTVPPQRLERWFARLFKPTSPTAAVGRLLNRFSLGADPEFVLLMGGARENATVLALKAGAAFGADNNGRLVEIRPAPSRSALEVLASIWHTLYWLGRFHPQTFKYTWRAGGFIEGDGLGGHIHYGRKAKTRRLREIQSLDRLTHLAFTAGLFDSTEGRARYRHSHGGHYGGPGDVRTQPHGWEYRTLPSWLDSPWLAYCTITLGKLAVAVPDLFPPLSQVDGKLSAQQALSFLKLYLAYFASFDDDARLAYNIAATRGFPMHIKGGDIKANWGIFEDGPLSPGTSGNLPKILPDLIPIVGSTAREELASAMYEGRIPDIGAPVPSWTPTKLPPGYIQMLNLVDTDLQPGIGELAVGLAVRRENPISFHSMGNGALTVSLPSDYAHKLSKLRQLLFPHPVGVLGSEGTRYIYLNTGKHLPLSKLFWIRDVLVKSREFPMWFLDEVKETSYQEWQQQRTSPADKRRNTIVFYGS